VSGRNHVEFFPTILRGSGCQCLSWGGKIGSEVERPNSVVELFSERFSARSIWEAKYFPHVHGFPLDGQRYSDDEEFVIFCVGFNSRVIGHSSESLPN
jgi:hypothetical protein